MLEKNLQKINRNLLSRNPNAIHLLEENPEKIDWIHLSRNSSIFKKEVNYNFLKERMNLIREEVVMKCMHPRRLERWMEQS